MTLIHRADIFAAFLLFFLSYQWPSANGAQLCGVQKSSKIGIVGGGVSGLFLSHHLAQDGFTDITVLEREDHVAHICNTTWVNGKPFDASIVFAGAQIIPSNPSLWKSLEPLQAVVSPMLASLPAILPASVFAGLPLGTARIATEKYTAHLLKLGLHYRAVTPLPTKDWAQIVPMMQAIDREPIKSAQELVRMWRFMEEWIDNGIGGVLDCLQHNLALPTETFGQWIVRHNMNSVGVYMAFMFDFFGNPTTLSAPACQVLAGSILKWQGAVPFFSLVAVQKNVLAAAYIPPLMMVKALIGLQNNVLLYRIEEGYCEVFKRTQQATRAQFHFSETVLSVNPSVKSDGCNTVSITTTAKKYQFDHVILALRPQDLFALNFKEFEAFARVFYQVQIVKLSGKIDASQRLSNLSNDILDPLDASLGTTHVNLDCHMQGLDAQWPLDIADVVVVFGNGNTAQFGDNFRSDLLRLFKFDVLQTYFSRIYDQGPNYRLDQNITDFYVSVNKRQGVNSIYFLGEYLAGHGVPENFEFSDKFARIYFSNVARAGATSMLHTAAHVSEISTNSAHEDKAHYCALDVGEYLKENPQGPRGAKDEL